MIGIGQTAGKGRGVFAWAPIAKGALIEEAPVIVVPAPEIEHLESTALADYWFHWGRDEKDAALVLGTCSLCNHSYEPNAVFVPRPERQTVAFYAHRDIAPGEEITTNYNGDPTSRKPVWFDVLP